MEEATALLRRGLLRRGAHPDAPVGAAGATALEVTEPGRVGLAQTEGLRIRLPDRVVGALGPRDTAGLGVTAQALTGALDGAVGRRPARYREIDARRVARRRAP